MDQARGIFEEDLPPSMRELWELVGRDATLTLCRKFGGTTHVVPLNLIAGHAIRLEIGDEAMLKLIRRYAPGRLYIPKLDEALRVARNLEIVKRYSAREMTAKELALKYRLTERQIWNILGTPEPARDTNQLTLF